jgi:hypothetical protein
MAKKINPYDFVGFQFTKDCLLFGKKEMFFITLGIITWICIIGIVTVLFFLTYLINILWQIE